MRKAADQPRRSVPRAVRARIGYFVGVLLIAAGLGWQLGYGWGLVAGGVGLVTYMVLLYDVEELPPFDPDGEVRLR